MHHEPPSKPGGGRRDEPATSRHARDVEALAKSTRASASGRWERELERFPHQYWLLAWACVGRCEWGEGGGRYQWGTSLSHS
jgi:hypothetical protein